VGERGIASVIAVRVIGGGSVGWHLSRTICVGHEEWHFEGNGEGSGGAGSHGTK